MNSKKINLKSEYGKTNIQEVLDMLDNELIGLESVKQKIKEISSLLLIDTVRKRNNQSSLNLSLHMSFSGSPGTGKTTVASKMALILANLDYIKKGHLISVSREDLVGQYIGHTAPKTREVLKKAMGGILFIDEAYYLYKPENERDYGKEAIEILLQIMENHREDLVIIFAGYKTKLEKFYKSNPGLSSRVTNHVDFPDYSTEDLIVIGKFMLREYQYCMAKETEELLFNYIEAKKNNVSFANARTIKNVLNKSKICQATRIFESSNFEVNKKNLMTIKEIDLLYSVLEEEKEIL
jgi:probable Rubsico expression protein CbbX